MLRIYNKGLDRRRRIGTTNYIDTMVATLLVAVRAASKSTMLQIAQPLFLTCVA